MNTGGSNKGPVAFNAMVARPRELLRELREGKDTVKALKAIKNQVIGSKTKKAAFIGEGAVEQVLEVLKACSGDRQELVQQQAAVVIGSLTYGTEAGLRELITHQGMPHLVAMLHSSDPAVVEAGLRAVKMVVQQVTPLPSYLSDAALGTDTAAAAAAAAAATAGAIKLDSTAVTAVVQCLVQQTSQEADQGGLLPITAPTTAATPAPASAPAPAAASVGPGGRNGSLAALAAAVVACCCRREQERTLAISAGAPVGLLQLLLGSQRADIQVAALEGLSLMLPHHPPSCALALGRPGVYGRLQALLRDPAPAVRLLSASCVATLSRTPGCEQSEAMQRAALPVLLRLLAQPATRPHVPAVLARLIEGSEPLQKAAADADTVRLLAGLLAAEAAPPPASSAAVGAADAAGTAPTKAAAAEATAPGAAATAAAADSPPSSSAATSASASSLREGCLRALGSLCLNRDDSRKQLLEAKVLRHIVRSLEDPSEGVRSAAALCVRALSRCVRTLRGGLLDGGGDLAPVLVGLLGDPNADVQTSAAAALANLVLDFSSAKAGVLAAGGLPRLASLVLPSTATTATGSSGVESPPQLRHHAAWALANLTYRADSGVRNQLMQALPWPHFRQLLYDADPGVVEQALVMLRNLSMGDRLHVRAALEWAGCGPLLRRQQHAQQHPCQQGTPGAGQAQRQGAGQQGFGNAADSAVLVSEGGEGGGGDTGLLAVLQEFIEAAGEAVAAAVAAKEETREVARQGGYRRVYRSMSLDLEDVLQRSESEEDEEDEDDDGEEEEEEEDGEEEEDTEMEVAALAPESGAPQGPSEPAAAPPSSHTAAAPASTVADAVFEALAAVLASSQPQPQPQPQPQHRRRHAPQHAMTHGSHALFAVVNLLTGCAEVKDAVAARRPLMAAVVTNLRPEAAAELALPAVWCAINLAWPPSSSPPGSGAAGAGAGGGEGRAEVEAGAARCRALMDLGAAERLEQLQRSHPSRDVQERAKTALEQLHRAAAAAVAVAAAAASGAAGSASAAGH